MPSASSSDAGSPSDAAQSESSSFASAARRLNLCRNPHGQSPARLTSSTNAMTAVKNLWNAQLQQHDILRSQQVQKHFTASTMYCEPSARLYSLATCTAWPGVCQL